MSCSLASLPSRTLLTCVHLKGSQQRCNCNSSSLDQELQALQRRRREHLR
jgi:hypothetical protein